MNKVLRLLTMIGLLLFETTVYAIDMESPVNGWMDSSLDKSSSEMTFAYPKPPVDRGGQRYRTLIKGNIRKAGKNRPGKFVVNGIPMPLYTDEVGSFVKPWAFGPGSNNVEIRNPGGTKRKRVQFYDSNATKTRAKIRMVLGWDDAKAEVDLHVVTPDGQHAFWAQPVLDGGGGLDVDSVDGGGPEIFSVSEPSRGIYLIYVNYWGNFDPAGYNFDASRHERPLITTTVTIITNENTINEKIETYVVPLRRIGDLTLVKVWRY